MLIQTSSALVLLLAPLSWGNATQPAGKFASDSADLRNHAERLQQRFERTRWEHLPWTYGSSGRCDIRIGRYCFTFDDDRDWDPPPEDAQVIANRKTLVEALDSARLALPGDSWILTQFVRYTVELGETDRALHATSACALTETWLCHALAGFVNHIAEAYQTAEREFDRSLGLMATSQRCEWEDLSDLLTGKVRSDWRDRDCENRSGLRDTLFWLSDPLYAVPGNELRTEHFSRHVASLMIRQARGPDRERWNRVSHEIIMRYGWPIGWERVREFRSSLRPPMVTHYGSDGSATFLPTQDVVRDPMAVAPDEWEIDPDRPQSNHSPPYAYEAFEDLAVNWSMFRRGDSATVVYIVSLSHELVDSEQTISFSVAISRDPKTPTLVKTDTVRDTTHVLIATSEASRRLVSLEAQALDVGVAGRSRFGLNMRRLHQPGLVASDVLVLAPTDSLPAGLDQAIAMVRPPKTYVAGERFMLYWEMYGVQPNVSYSTTISLNKTSKGLFRRLAEITPFASHEPAVHVMFEDAAHDPYQPVARSLAVDLPPEISNGKYRLTLTIQGATGELVERTIALVVDTPS